MTYAEYEFSVQKEKSGKNVYNKHQTRELKFFYIFSANMISFIIYEHAGAHFLIKIEEKNTIFF